MIYCVSLQGRIEATKTCFETSPEKLEVCSRKQKNKQKTARADSEVDVTRMKQNRPRMDWRARAAAAFECKATEL
jgi:hypothetical protein